LGCGDRDVGNLQGEIKIILDGVAIVPPKIIAFVELLGFKIPVYEGDDTESLAYRIHVDPEIPFCMTESKGQLALMHEPAIHDIKIEFEIKI
jgi:hypothetical protein